jgi:2-oxo-4-hydroxy-4-carboxy-5-ureidoimidazoline decarboxylase
MTQEINLAFINSASQEDFTQLLAEIYEHSSWIPNQAWLQRPFDSIESLHQTMLKIVEDAKLEQQLALLCAHPQLAGKEAKSGELTDSSTEEQSSANLNALSREELDEITALNKQYMDAHGFPFIIAVKNHNKAGIYNEFKRRINLPTNDELHQAIWQVGLIAGFRLSSLFPEYDNTTGN